MRILGILLWKCLQILFPSLSESKKSLFESMSGLRVELRVSGFMI